MYNIISKRSQRPKRFHDWHATEKNLISNAHNFKDLKNSLQKLYKWRCISEKKC
jgi:hypothetical protein